MLSYRSELKLDKDGRLSLPKLKSTMDLNESPVRRPSLINIDHEKKHL